MHECLDYLEWMNALLDGEATPQQTDLLEAHLAACPRCQALFHDLTALHQGAEALVVPPPAGFSARVMEAVAQTVPSKKKVIPLHSWRSLGALAAVCALALLGSGALRYFQEGQQPPQDIPSQVAVSPAEYGGEPSPGTEGVAPFAILSQEEDPASPLPEASTPTPPSATPAPPASEGPSAHSPRMAIPPIPFPLKGAGAPLPQGEFQPCGSRHPHPKSPAQPSAPDVQRHTGSPHLGGGPGLAGGAYSW